MEIKVKQFDGKDIKKDDDNYGAVCQLRLNSIQYKWSPTNDCPCRIQS